MDTQPILFMIAVGAIILLVACCVKGKMEHFLNLILRGLLGAVAIHFANAILCGLGLSLDVGINLLTILVIGTLGIPGFLGLYAIGIYRTF